MLDGEIIHHCAEVALLRDRYPHLGPAAQQGL
jgi:hypothetical protein